VHVGNFDVAEACLGFHRERVAPVVAMGLELLAFSGAGVGRGQAEERKTESARED
jgi:hypothetical protein